jgi:hypothetical protein
MEIAMPVIIDDVQIINDCTHLQFIIDKYTSIQDLYCKDKIIPEDFEKELERVKEEIKHMQDMKQGEGDQEYDYEEEEQEEQEEQDEQDDVQEQIVHFTEPPFSKVDRFMI